MSSSLPRSVADYTVGWICALSIELAAARQFLDAEHSRLHRQRAYDDNEYILGSIEKHHVVLALLPQGIYGKVSAATVGQQMRATFPRIKLWLMVGIGGGVPFPSGSDDVHLGDVIVGSPSGTHGGIIQYDLGKTLSDGRVQHTGSVNAPHHKFLTAIGVMKALEVSTTKTPAFYKLVRNVTADSGAGTFYHCYPGPDKDDLYRASYKHSAAHPDCSACDPSQLEIRKQRPSTVPRVHYGLIASGDQVMKDAETRDKLARQFGIKCFEMEAAGIVNSLSCLVIRGACDYCDSHKQDDWHPYAALVAAAYTKTLLQIITAEFRATETETVMAMDLQKRKQMLSWWISGSEDVDTRGDVENNTRLRHADTCSWLFGDDKFQYWHTDLGSKSTLWYNAPIGSGKTVLSAAVVEYLRKLGKNVVYFCYSFKNRSRKNFLVGLRSLAVQLIDLSQDDFLEEIEVIRARQMTEESAKHMPEQMVRTVFQKALRPFNLVYVVIDGLDECDKEKPMLQDVVSLISERRLGCVKWFITSRNEKRIRDMFTKLGVLELSPSPQVLWSDINKYLSSGLEDENDIQTPVEQPTRSKTDKIGQWTTICDGNFLYSKFVLETLQEHHSITSRRKLLAEFPGDLQQWYLRTLAKLCDESAEDRELVRFNIPLIIRRTFMYLVYAEKSLTWVELLQALSIDRKKLQYDRDDVIQKAKIEQLCGAFLYWDNHTRSEEKDSRSVRLSHKTVLDFLLQDTSEINIGNLFPNSDLAKNDLLRSFFPDSADAAREIGLDCLWYLSYKRYRNIDKAIDFYKRNEDEDAFLRYAAAFWFRALKKVRQGDEPSGEVCRFLRSPNFWTCISIQSFIAPYLFSRYNRHSDNKFTMDLSQPGSTGPALYGHPLPDWLAITECGQALDWDFCHFLTDWNEVIASHPGQLAHCVPLRKMNSGLGHHLSSHPSIKVCRPGENAEVGPGVLMCPQCPVLHEDSLCLDFLQQDDRSDAKETAVHFCRVEVFGKCKILKKQIHDNALTRGTIIDFSLAEPDSKPYVWYFHNTPLRLERVVDGQGEIFEAPFRWHGSNAEAAWTVIKTRKLSTEPDAVCIIYVSRRVSVETRKDSGEERIDDWFYPSDDESEQSIDNHDRPYGAEDYDGYDSEEDSDMESDDSNHSSHEASDHHTSDSCRFNVPPSPTDGIVLLHSSGPPLWLLLGDNPADLTSFMFAVQAKTNSVVWKSNAAESSPLEVENSAAWKVAAFVSNFNITGAQNSMYHDLHLSTCGQYLYSLDLSAMSQTDPSLQISLHSYRYPPRLDEDGANEQAGPPQHVTYRVTKRLAGRPLGAIYTCWGEDELVMVLPPVTCKPKIIKFNLPRMQITPSIEILNSPIYLPATLGQNSTMIYKPGQPGKKHQLFIHLFRESQGDDCGSQPADARMEPVVIRWLISRKAGVGWRPWDQERDGQLEGWDQHTDLIMMLRGKYMDDGVKFDVPTRSGLDWTRKAYLSCY